MKVKVKSIPKLKGKRDPTPEEVAAVGRYMTAYYKKTARFAAMMEIVFLIAGLLLCIAGVFHESVSEGTVICVIGAISLLTCMAAAMSRSRDLEYIAIFDNGLFHVVDGHVSKTVATEHDAPGSVSVEYTSEEGETIKGYFSVPRDGVDVNMPLLLVYVVPEDGLALKRLSWVFSEYMLSKDGVKHLK